MKCLELVIEEFEKKLQKNGLRADYSKKVIDFNVYFTNSCKPFLDQKGLSESLVDVKQKFESVFDLSFDYKFSLIQDVEPFTDTYQKIINSYDKSEVTEDVLKLCQKVVNQYKSHNELLRKLYDYFEFIELTDDKSKSSLHCIVSGIKGYGKSKKYRTVGASIIGNNYLIISLYDELQQKNKRSSDELKKTFMHEISHCFGADHSNIPESIMNYKIKGSLLWWDKPSKCVIKKGIKKFFKN